MLSKKMEAALNDQVVFELHSAYLYLSMASYFESLGLSGMANWMQVQYQEETFHGMKFFGYVHERGGRVQLKGFADVPTNWASPLDAFQSALAHEEKVTARINALMDEAVKERDHATANFLQWFIGEQVEEEASVSDIINKLKLVESTTGGLFMLDKDLGTRVFTPPANA